MNALVLSYKEIHDPSMQSKKESNVDFIVGFLNWPKQNF